MESVLEDRHNYDMIIMSLFSHPSVFGYNTSVHEKITYHAINESSLEFVLRRIGFHGGIEQTVKGWEDCRFA